MEGIEETLRALSLAAKKLARLDRSLRAPQLHKRPSPEAVARLVATMPVPPPASYLSFLLRHDGFEAFWEGFDLVGTGPTAARHDIDSTVASAVLALPRPEVLDAKKLFTRRENENAKFVYLPNHVVFGTNHGGRLLFFDRRTRNAEGEMEVALFARAGGVVRRFKSFRHLLVEALASIRSRLVDGGSGANVRNVRNVRSDDGVYDARKAMLAALHESIVPPPMPPPAAPSRKMPRRTKK